MPEILSEILPKRLHPAIAYLLVSHGSRDPRPQAAAAQLAMRLAARLPADLPGPVGTAQLECAALPLHQQMVEFGRSQFGSETGAASHRLIVLPLFLLPGVHVMEDLPAEIALAQQTLGPRIHIEVRPYLGTQPGLQRLVQDQMAALPMAAWILLAHGSRRAQGNQPVADMAQAVGAIPAYWSVAPALGDRLPELIQQGHQKIGILPYFLFSGGITDAIAQSVAALAQQFPDLTWHQASPLDASPALIDVLLEMVRPI